MSRTLEIDQSVLSDKNNKFKSWYVSQPSRIDLERQFRNGIDINHVAATTEVTYF